MESNIEEIANKKIPTADELLEYHVAFQEKAILKKIENEIENLKTRIKDNPFVNFNKTITLNIDGKVLNEVVEKVESNFENIGYSIKFSKGDSKVTWIELNYSNK